MRCSLLAASWRGVGRRGGVHNDQRAGEQPGTGLPSRGKREPESSPVQTIATGGGGSGLQLADVDSLGSAGSIQLDEGHHLLFVVNTETAAANNGAGAYKSDCNQGSITSFLVGSDGTLTFADRVFSRGLFPHSLTVRSQKRERGELLYVLNSGGAESPVCSEQPAMAGQPNITGFKVDRAGNMEPVASAQPINPGPGSGPGENCPGAQGLAAFTGAPAADFQCGLNPPSFVRSPAQVRFTPDGHQLLVTVKGTNTIYIFPVGRRGEHGQPHNNAGFRTSLTHLFWDDFR